jgi:hypothetical protein
MIEQFIQTNEDYFCLQSSKEKQCQEQERKSLREGGLIFLGLVVIVTTIIMFAKQKKKPHAPPTPPPH